MEVFVSEKEIDNNGLNYVEDDFVEEYWQSKGVSRGKGFEFCDDVGLVKIQSLEQHEKELLREFATEVNAILKRLKSEYSHLCKTQKEAREETCRYEGVCRVQNELNKLLKERGVE